MSEAEFDDLRDRCTEAWALAELGRVSLEPKKSLYRRFGIVFGIILIVLGGVNTAEATGLLADQIGQDAKTVSAIVGVLTIIAGGIMSTIDPRRKSDKVKEAWMLLGTKQRELITLIDEVRQRTVRGTDNGTYRANWHKINELLDAHDVPSSRRIERAAEFQSDCSFRTTVWRGNYIGDDSPTSEEADNTMKPVGQEV